MKWIKEDGGRKDAFPNQKLKTHVGDCVVRALSIAMEQKYKTTMNDLFALGLELGCMPNTDQCWREYLSRKGWIENKFGKQLVRINSIKIPRDQFVLCQTAGHLVAINDAELYDTFDARKNSRRDWKRVFRYYVGNKSFNGLY
tara:strand:+ start:1933 stop:2361 length:429 start_codon:yes stop_codon:yes gene_type:complete